MTKHKNISNIRNWKSCIRKLKKKLYVDEFNISSTAVSFLNDYLSALTEKLSFASTQICLNSQRVTLKDENVLSACDASFSSISESVRKEYNSFGDVTGSNPHKRREEAYGLSFSVSLSENYLRYYSSNINISKNAPVVIALVLEIVCKLILNGSKEVASSFSKKIINPRMMFLSMNDETITPISKFLNVEMVGVGVIPRIDERLIPSESKKKKMQAARKRNRANKKKSGYKQKYMPGTKALLQIKKFQKGSNVLITKAPFFRTMKQLIGNETYRYRKNFVSSFQSYIEKNLIELFSSALLLALYSGRDSVADRDLIFAWNNKFPAIQLEEDFVEEVLTKNCITRLTYRAGVKRKLEQVYDVTRRMACTLMKRTLISCSGFVNARKGVTLERKDLYNSLRLDGVYLCSP